jgi:hypothetical protein
MSFRCGNHGFEMWPRCRALGVAAITYIPLTRIDLSKYPIGEPKRLWNQLEPTQKASLRRIVSEMSKGDVIYVKQGVQIVGRGIVQGKYHFDKKYRLVDRDGDPWAHQVPVKWDDHFNSFRILLGSEPLTVKELSNENIKQIKRALRKADRKYKEQEVIEGEEYRREILFRKRNQSLIESRKLNSNYRCEICGFSFFERYGEIGRNFIIAHHVKPIGKRKKPTKTKGKEISIICANCHSIIHRESPPISPRKLQKLLINDG